MRSMLFLCRSCRARLHWHNNKRRKRGSEDAAAAAAQAAAQPAISSAGSSALTDAGGQPQQQQPARPGQRCDLFGLRWTLCMRGMHIMAWPRTKKPILARHLPCPSSLAIRQTMKPMA